MGGGRWGRGGGLEEEEEEESAARQDDLHLKLFRGCGRLPSLSVAWLIFNWIALLTQAYCPKPLPKAHASDRRGRWWQSR